MKKYFLGQVNSPRDTLRALMSASLVSALFGLVTIARAITDSRDTGGVSIIGVIVGIYLFVNFSGIAWVALGKLKADKK